MFRKLRNRFVATSMLISSIILILAFSAVFITTAAGSSREVMDRPRPLNMPQEVRAELENELKSEKERHLMNLACALITVGIFAEMLIFVISYCCAERAILPVRKAYRKQRDFVANASHELKTPIAAAQANFEALGATEQPWAHNVEVELERASKLVNDMLVLARVDSRKRTVKKEEIEVGAVVKRQTELIRARLKDKALMVKVAKDVKMKLNKADLVQIVDILLDNAVKYSKDKVEVLVDERKITVKNDGKGIPKDRVEYIFDRFYQTDKTANGVGLGLAIAWSVAEQNGWRLEVEAEQDETSFSLSYTK